MLSVNIKKLNTFPNPHRKLYCTSLHILTLVDLLILARKLIKLELEIYFNCFA